MVFKKMLILAVVSLIVSLFSSCTLPSMLNGYRFPDVVAKSSEASGATFVNYALASRGATVRASGSIPGHPPESVINGVKDSAAWGEGEGWECRFVLRRYYRPGYRYRYYYWWYDYYGRRYWEDALWYADESSWIEVSLPRRQKINRVVVHAYYSKKQVRHGLGDALLQTWDGGRWANIAEVRDGFIHYPTRRKPDRGRYELTFVPVETDRIRLFILRGDGKSMRPIQASGAEEEHWVRLMEIEVTGTEQVGTSLTVDAPRF